MGLGCKRFSWCTSNGAGLRKTKCLLIAGSDAARRRTRGHGCLGIKAPSAGHRTLPSLGRYCPSNCSAPVARRAKGTSFRAVPREAFGLPELHKSLCCSLERAMMQLRNHLNCSSPAQNSALAPAAARGSVGGCCQPKKLGFV